MRAKRFICLMICVVLFCLIFIDGKNPSLSHAETPEAIRQILQAKDPILEKKYEELPEGTFSIEEENGVFTLKAHHADANEMLEELVRKTGIKLIKGKEFQGGKALLYHKELPLEDAIRLITGLRPLKLYSDKPDPSGKYKVRSILLGHDIEPKDMGLDEKRIEIPYGSGEGQVGYFDYGEGGSGNPLAFDVDKKGNIYICDTVYGRVQVYSPDGAFLRTLASRKDTAPRDIVVDDRGNVFIAYLNNMIVQYDLSGNEIGSIMTDSRRWGNVSNPSMIKRGENLYLLGVWDRGYQIVGKMINGKLTESDSGSLSMDGHLGRDGKKYKRKTMGSYREILEYEVSDQKGKGKIVSFEFPPGLDVYRILDTSNAGNINFIVSRRTRDGSHLYIYRFNPGGKLTEIIPVYRGKAGYPPIKRYAFRHNSVYQMLLTPDKMEIIIHRKK